MPDAWQPGLDYVLGGADLERFDLDFETGTLRAEPTFGAGRASLAWRGRDGAPACLFETRQTEYALIIDSGAARSSLNHATAEFLIRTGAAVGQWFEVVDQGVVLRKLRIASLRSGQAVFNEALFDVRPPGSRMRTRGGPVDGLIGVDLLSAARWGFDYRERQAAAVMYRSLPGPQYEAGVDIRTDAGDPGRIVGLAVNGPARLAGLALGDRIVSFGGAAPADTAAFEATGDPGRPERIPVEFERDGYVRSVVIETRHGV